MNRQIYASDGVLFIYRIREEDRSDYTRLHAQINGKSSLFLNPASADLMWDATLNSENLIGKNKVYVIFDKDNNFCGSTDIQRSDSETPEIGIDLLEEHRNKGIGPRAVKLIARTYYNDNNVDHFIIRISSDNLHSKHVFEKLGAVYIGKEDSVYVKTMKLLNELSKKYGDVADLIEEHQKKSENVTESEDNFVYRYKFLPESFIG